MTGVDSSGQASTNSEFVVQSTRDRAIKALLVARCENVTEPDGIPCPGRLRYRWGQSDAACDTCGGRCGIAVANWERVEPDGLRALAGEAGAPDTPPADSPDLTEAERAELERLRTFQEVWVTPLLAELQQARAQVLAEKREHLRTLDDALKVRDAWTAQHAALLALANELDGPNEALAAAARMLRETLGAEVTDG